MLSFQNSLDCYLGTFVLAFAFISDPELTTRDARRGHVRVLLRSIKDAPISEGIDDARAALIYGPTTSTRLSTVMMDLM